MENGMWKVEVGRPVSPRNPTQMTVRRVRQILRISVCFFLFVSFGFGQDHLQYKLPSDQIVSILESSESPLAILDPTGHYLLMIHKSSMPGIEELSRPMLKLAGKRFLPEPSAPIIPGNGSIESLSLIRIKDGKSYLVDTPEEVRLSDPIWSPDGKNIAFACIRSDTVEIWISETESGNSKLLIDGVNLASGGFSWLPNSRSIICRLIPPGRGGEPENPSVPIGPVVQQTENIVAKTRTYQDLLSSPQDCALYEYYFTSQLALIDIESEKIRRLGNPGLFDSVEISPDGKLILIEHIQKPYSYLVPESHFPRNIEIWSFRGKKLKTIAEIGLNEAVPIDGVRTEPRSFEWVPILPSALIWAEALDGGDPNTEAEYRDRVVLFQAKSKKEPVELIRTQSRYISGSRAGRTYWAQTGHALFTEFDRKKQWVKTWAVNLKDPGNESAKLIWDRNLYDGYNDPGRPLTQISSSGHLILRMDGNRIFLTGLGSSKSGERPFLDSFDLQTQDKQRLFESGKDAFERVEAVLPDKNQLLTRFETRNFAPNLFVLNTETGEKRQLTKYLDPSPELRGISKQLIRYWREDGIELSGTLYLPADYKEGTRIPLVMWAYPREYTDPKIASQVRGSSNRFTTISGASHLLFVTQGYAVLDGPAMPVIGENGNDTFVEQLVMNAKAAIDKVVDMGVTRRDRIGIGGHSYGAFMTANLLAHSDFFAAGIARSGAYNRTLTPFGFQNERRIFWEAPEVYFDMSPFMHVDRINEPILLIHGEADNNSGTFPIQSTRLFHAIKGLGGSARLVILPNESHGYIARESIFHTLAEMIEWFDKHIKKMD